MTYFLRRLRQSKFLIYLVLGAIIWLAFSLRLAFIERFIFHADEFISLLAVRRILEIGTPHLPSGQFYDHGLLFSYITAAFAAVVGTAPAAVRWVSLLFSVLTIPLMYRAGARFFDSHAAGLMVGLTMAIYPHAILWGGRIRMYSLAQFLSVLAVFCIWLGLSRSSRRYRVIGYLALFGALFSHLAMILLIPPLVVAGLLLRQLQQPAQWRQAHLRRSDWLEAGLAALLVALVLGVGQAGFIARASANPELDVANTSNDVGSLLDSVVSPESAARAASILLHYAEETENRPLMALLLVGLATALVKLYRQRLTAADQNALFLGAIILLLIVEVVFVLGSSWNNGRYYYLWFYPLLVWLAGYGAVQLANLLQQSVARLWPYRKFNTLESAILLAVAVWLIAVFWPESRVELAETFKTYRYDQGWRYVNQAAANNDTTLTSWPSAAALFSNRVDYYTNQTRSLALANPKTGQITDRYAGAQYLESPADLNAVLVQPGKTWYVIEDARLFNFLSAAVLSQIFHQMRLDQSFANIHVFVERDTLWPLAETPAHPMQVNLSNQMIFKGYSLYPAQPTAAQPAGLTLFWQPINPIFNYKIFVHLQDEAGQTVIQADFVPLEGSGFDLRAWTRNEGSDSTLAVGVPLLIPPELPPGQYTLWLGMYEPTTLQRLPITNDTSGENAINAGQITR